MNDPKPLVSDQESVNEEPLPAPKFTDPSGASPTSEKRSDDLTKLAKRLEQVEKAQQSVKDKRISTLEKNYGKLAARLKKRGVEVDDDVFDEVVNEVEKEEEVTHLRERLEKLEVSRTSPGKVEGQEADIWKQVTTETQLDSVSIALLAGRAARGEFRNPEHLMLEAHRMAKGQTPPPRSGVEDVSLPVKPKPKATIEDLTGEYKTKLKAARGNTKEWDAVRKEYLGKGVNIYEVDFT